MRKKAEDEAKAMAKEAEEAKKKKQAEDKVKEEAAQEAENVNMEREMGR